MGFFRLKSKAKFGDGPLISSIVISVLRVLIATAEHDAGGCVFHSAEKRM